MSDNTKTGSGTPKQVLQERQTTKDVLHTNEGINTFNPKDVGVDPVVDTTDLRTAGTADANRATFGDSMIFDDIVGIETGVDESVRSEMLSISDRVQYDIEKHIDNFAAKSSSAKDLAQGQQREAFLNEKNLTDDFQLSRTQLENRGVASTDILMTRSPDMKPNAAATLQQLADAGLDPTDFGDGKMGRELMNNLAHSITHAQAIADEAIRQSGTNTKGKFRVSVRHTEPHDPGVVNKEQLTGGTHRRRALALQIELDADIPGMRNYAIDVPLPHNGMYASPSGTRIKGLVTRRTSGGRASAHEVGSEVLHSLMANLSESYDGKNGGAVRTAARNMFNNSMPGGAYYAGGYIDPYEIIGSMTSIKENTFIAGDSATSTNAAASARAGNYSGLSMYQARSGQLVDPRAMFSPYIKNGDMPSGLFTPWQHVRGSQSMMNRGFVTSAMPHLESGALSIERLMSPVMPSLNPQKEQQMIRNEIYMNHEMLGNHRTSNVGHKYMNAQGQVVSVSGAQQFGGQTLPVSKFAVFDERSLGQTFGVMSQFDDRFSALTVHEDMIVASRRVSSADTGIKFLTAETNLKVLTRGSPIPMGASSELNIVDDVIRSATSSTVEATAIRNEFASFGGSLFDIIEKISGSGARAIAMTKHGGTFSPGTSLGFSAQAKEVLVPHSSRFDLTDIRRVKGEDAISFVGVSHHTAGKTTKVTSGLKGTVLEELSPNNTKYMAAIGMYIEEVKHRSGLSVKEQNVIINRLMNAQAEFKTLKRFVNEAEGGEIKKYLAAATDVDYVSPRGGGTGVLARGAMAGELKQKDLSMLVQSFAETLAHPDSGPRLATALEQQSGGMARVGELLTSLGYSVAPDGRGGYAIDAQPGLKEVQAAMNAKRPTANQKMILELERSMQYSQRSAPEQLQLKHQYKASGGNIANMTDEMFTAASEGTTSEYMKKFRGKNRIDLQIRELEEMVFKTGLGNILHSQHGISQEDVGRSQVSRAKMSASEIQTAYAHGILPAHVEEQLYKFANGEIGGKLGEVRNAYLNIVAPDLRQTYTMGQFSDRLSAKSFSQYGDSILEIARAVLPNVQDAQDISKMGANDILSMFRDRYSINAGDADDVKNKKAATFISEVLYNPEANVRQAVIDVMLEGKTGIQAHGFVDRRWLRAKKDKPTGLPLIDEALESRRRHNWAVPFIGESNIFNSEELDVYTGAYARKGRQKALGLFREAALGIFGFEGAYGSGPLPDELLDLRNAVGADGAPTGQRIAAGKLFSLSNYIKGTFSMSAKGNLLEDAISADVIKAAGVVGYTDVRASSLVNNPHAEQLTKGVTAFLDEDVIIQAIKAEMNLQSERMASSAGGTMSELVARELTLQHEADQLIDTIRSGGMIDLNVLRHPQQGISRNLPMQIASAAFYGTAGQGGQKISFYMPNAGGTRDTKLERQTMELMNTFLQMDADGDKSYALFDLGKTARRYRRDFHRSYVQQMRQFQSMDKSIGFKGVFDALVETGMQSGGVGKDRVRSMASLIVGNDVLAGGRKLVAKMKHQNAKGLEKQTLEAAGILGNNRQATIAKVNELTGITTNATNKLSIIMKDNVDIFEEVLNNAFGVKGSGAFKGSAGVALIDVINENIIENLSNAKNVADPDRLITHINNLSKATGGDASPVKMMQAYRELGQYAFGEFSNADMSSMSEYDKQVHHAMGSIFDNKNGLMNNAIARWGANPSAQQDTSAALINTAKAEKSSGVGLNNPELQTSSVHGRDPKVVSEVVDRSIATDVTERGKAPAQMPVATAAPSETMSPAHAPADVHRGKVAAAGKGASGNATQESVEMAEEVVQKATKNAANSSDYIGKHTAEQVVSGLEERVIKGFSQEMGTTAGKYLARGGMLGLGVLAGSTLFAAFKNSSTPDTLDDQAMQEHALSKQDYTQDAYTFSQPTRVTNQQYLHRREKIPSTVHHGQVMAGSNIDDIINARYPKSVVNIDSSVKYGSYRKALGKDYDVDSY